MKNALLATTTTVLISIGALGEVGLPQMTPEVGERVFREVGSYRILGGTLLREGQANELTMDGLLLEVFTDGIDIRIRPAGSEDSHLDFQIYRNSGIYDDSGENLLPGVQAFSDQGGVVRHLCIGPQKLTLTKFPASSTDLQVTYATRDES